MDYQMEELLPVVSELAQKYTGCESTSITYEKAQTLMEAVLFCLNEYNNSHANSLVHENISVKEQYSMGAKLIAEKVEDIRKIFNEISVPFDDYGVKCLHDTVRRDIPHFLKWYDIKFCPQDTIVTLDYPLLTDCSSLQGADAVYKYVRAIQTEQLFLHAFDRNYVMLVLERYHSEYREMAENICGIVLTNTIGHMAVEKPLRDIGFQHEEYLQLSEIFGEKSISDIESAVVDFIKTMVSQPAFRPDLQMEREWESRQNIAEYLCCDTHNMAVRIYMAAQNGKLSGVFVV